MERNVRWMMLAIGLAGAAPLPAQMIFRRDGAGGDANGLLEAAPASFGVSKWTVGEWGRYNLTQNLGPGGSIIRFRTVSVVGQDSGGYWIELQEEATGMMRAQMPTRKLLLPFGPVSERAMREMYTLFADSSIRRSMVVRPPATGGGAAAGGSFPQGWQRSGAESITTPAGTFPTIHWQKGEEDLWVAASAGPIGVVRYRGPDLQIELVAHGASGAKSRIPMGDGAGQ